MAQFKLRFFSDIENKGIIRKGGYEKDYEDCENILIIDREILKGERKIISITIETSPLNDEKLLLGVDLSLEQSICLAKYIISLSKIKTKSHNYKNKDLDG